jgi:hypothetical protein
MSEESDTQILGRKPFFKAVLDYCLARLVKALAASISLAIVGAFVSYLDHRDTNQTVWNGMGPKLQTAHEEIYRLVDSVNDLSNRVNKLDHQSK